MSQVWATHASEDWGALKPGDPRPPLPLSDASDFFRIVLESPWTVTDWVTLPSVELRCDGQREGGRAADWVWVHARRSMHHQIHKCPAPNTRERRQR